MIIKNLDSWSAFLNELVELEQRREGLKRASNGHVSELLYRGQGDACWKLETTLDRVAKREVRDSDYLKQLKIIRHEIEAVTGTRWSDNNFESELKKFREAPLPPPAYEYMAYLRHHGFPTPLLDWTASALVAAYLAFREERPKVKRVSIYAYLEYLGNGKTSCDQTPSVRVLGPTITTHRRHFLQQSQYTICVKASAKGLIYCSHESAFGSDNHEQDRLWKFTIPTTERKTALTYLHKANVTGFSLFGSEDSLMESLAIREFVIRN